VLNVSVRIVYEQRIDPCFPMWVCDGVFGENICYDKTVLSERYLQDVLGKMGLLIDMRATVLC
jgi:hypothetical protein